MKILLSIPSPLKMLFHGQYRQLSRRHTPIKTVLQCLLFYKLWNPLFDLSCSLISSTCVFSRSMDGEGNFNWRFVFPFSYIPAEKKLVVKEKVCLFLVPKLLGVIGPVHTWCACPATKMNVVPFRHVSALELACSPTTRKRSQLSIAREQNWIGASTARDKVNTPSTGEKCVGVLLLELVPAAVPGHWVPKYCARAPT